MARGSLSKVLIIISAAQDAVVLFSDSPDEATKAGICKEGTVSAANVQDVDLTSFDQIGYVLAPTAASAAGNSMCKTSDRYKCEVKNADGSRNTACKLQVNTNKLSDDCEAATPFPCRLGPGSSG